MRPALSSLVVSPLLFAVAIIIAKVALNGNVNVFAFNALRNTLAFSFTYIVRKCDDNSAIYFRRSNSSLWYWSALCGAANALGMSCSAISLARLNTAMFSFLLGTTVVMTPLLSHFMPCKSAKLQIKGWLAVLISIVGTILLEGCVEDYHACFSSGNWYSVVALGAAFFYSVYAYLIGLGSDHIDPGALTLGSLFVSCLTLTAMLAISFLIKGSNIKTDWFLSVKQLLCVAAVAIVEAFAWQFETLAVSALGASKAAAAIATEAPLTAMLAFVLLNEKLSYFQYVGCAFVFLAALVATSDEIVGKNFDDNSGINDNYPEELVELMVSPFDQQGTTSGI